MYVALYQNTARIWSEPPKPGRTRRAKEFIGFLVFQKLIGDSKFETQQTEKGKFEIKIWRQNICSNECSSEKRGRERK